MDLQAIFRLEVVVTLVTLENLLAWVFQPPFQGQFLFQKVFSQLKVQGSCAETLPFSWHIFLRLRDSSSSSILLMSHLPWCPRKMEGGASIEGEAEGLSLACQRLAESHALQGQVIMKR